MPHENTLANRRQRLVTVGVLLVLMIGRLSADCAKPARQWLGEFVDHVPIRTHGRKCPLQDAPDGSHLTSVFGGEIHDVPVVDEGVTLYREPHWTVPEPKRTLLCQLGS